MIRKIRNKISLLLVLSAAFSSCSKYDDSDLQNKFGDLTDRVATIEEWSKTVNTNITSLQGLITAMESNDVITSVTDLADKSGYTISFSKSLSITIKHGTIGANGTDGANGTNGANGADGTNGTNGANGTDGADGANGKDGTTPIIGAAKHSDGFYYWTIQGVLPTNWLLDNQGKMIRITGYDGAPGSPGINAISPKVEIDKNNEWSVSIDNGKTWASTGQIATGDAMFSSVVKTDTDVTFTLVGGTDSFTIPLVSNLTIGFDSYEKFIVTPINNTIMIKLPESLKQDDYSMIKAEIKSNGGTKIDAKTRSSDVVWGVTLTEPTFTADGKYNNDAMVTLSPPKDETLDGLATLEVTIIDKKGRESSATRRVIAFNGVIVNVTDESTLETEITKAGKNLDDITKLAVIGTMNAVDYTFIKTLKNIKVVDLSQTNITEIPEQAFYFGDHKVNHPLEQVVLPSTIISIGDGAFAMNDKLSSNITLTNVTSIGETAFGGCETFTDIDLPEIKTIGEGAFVGCTNLKNINLGNSLTKIGKQAFTSCDNLTSIIIPINVNVIESNTFNKCNKLTHIKMENPEPVIYNDIFDINPGKTILVPGDEAKAAYEAATGWKDNGHTFVAYN